MKETAILFPLHIHLLVSNNPQVSTSYARLITQSRLVHSARLDKVQSLLVGQKETFQSILKILFVFWLPWVLWGAGATLVAMCGLLTAVVSLVEQGLEHGPNSCGTRA